MFYYYFEFPFLILRIKITGIFQPVFLCSVFSFRNHIMYMVPMCIPYNNRLHCHIICHLRQYAANYPALPFHFPLVRRRRLSRSYHGLQCLALQVYDPFAVKILYGGLVTSFLFCVLRLCIISFL